MDITTPFDGKPCDVHDFITSVEDAFQRCSIPAIQRGAFLVDYLRGIPKAEVKALLAAGQTVGEVLTFIKDSYGEKLAAGELQRLFLERKHARVKESEILQLIWKSTSSDSRDGMRNCTPTQTRPWQSSS